MEGRKGSKILRFLVFYTVQVVETAQINMTEGSRTLRILCLHGYRQNAQAFREKTGALRKQFKKIDFHFLDAPHTVFDDENEDARSWWFTKENNSFRASDQSITCIGFDESVALVTDKCRTDGPYDGLLGFSQGACFTAILASLIQNEFGFKFVIMIAGFKSLVRSHEEYYKHALNIPSLHVIGESDVIIDKQKSEELYDHFEKETAVILSHAGGHYVPTNKLLKEQYLNFFKKFT